MNGADQPTRSGPAPAGLPLSPSQQRIWFLQRYDPADPAYHVVSLQRLVGRLDTAVLTRAVQEIVRRHEPLRTRFLEVEGTPAQQVCPDAQVPFDHVDLRGLPDIDQRLAALVEQWGERPFDLAQASLLRCGLARLSDDEYFFVACAHHLVADGWSMTVFRAELAALYEAFSAGHAAPLPPLPCGYGQHVARALADAAGPDFEQVVAYWVDRLAGVPALALPTDRPRPAYGAGDEPPGPRGDVLRTEVPAQLSAGVARLARTLRCTPFMVWLAAYQTLLCRYSGQDEICVGTALAGRNHSAEESLIGYFSATVALRADLAGDPTFAELVRQVRTTVIEAHSHGTVPFEQVTSVLPATRDRSRNPLFQTWFTMHTQTVGGHRTAWGPELVAIMPRARREPAAVEHGPLDRSYDLMVDFWPGEQTDEFAVTYDRTLFDRQTIVDLVDRLLRLLGSAVDDPDQRVSHVPLLAPGQAGTVLPNRAAAQRDATGRDGGDWAGVVDLFLAQCRQTPQAPAVACGDDLRSFARLAADSAAVAASIRAAGLGPGDIVGVHLTRSPYVVTALLGTLRAGATYLPLDPAHPGARIEFMLRDSGAAAVLSDGPGAERLRGYGVPIIRVDAETAPPDGTVSSGGIALPGPRDAAYVIYTSGSTGTPKAVVVEHGSLAARVAWMREEYQLTAADRVAQFASLSFDTHAEELYPVLTAGGTVAVPDVPSERFPEWLAGTAGRAVTVLDLPTAYWHQLVYDLRPELWPSELRMVIIGGSQADSAAVRAWRELFGDRVRLVNTYGPTETTIVATATDLGAVDAVHRPPIGRPVAQTTAYVLDPAGQLVPPGMLGELYLAGAGVTRGYLGRPELTARAFLPDPFGPPGSRMFRTGDRARLARDGRLEYLGRMDRQLKVRGYRIEPGEIEAALTGRTDVAQAVVTARDESLVAYLVPAPGAVPVAAEVRTHLARLLPAYLVPNAFVLLDRLPLTRSGKPDVSALPAPATVEIDEAKYIAPRTDAEELVAEVWAEVLGRDRVGAEDDFFELGGHSLLATRVIARLRAETDVELSLRALFEAPTVAGMAQELEQMLGAEVDAMSDDEVARLLADQAGQR